MNSLNQTFVPRVLYERARNLVGARCREWICSFGAGKVRYGYGGDTQGGRSERSYTLFSLENRPFSRGLVRFCFGTHCEDFDPGNRPNKISGFLS